MLCQTLTLEIYVKANLSLWNHGQRAPYYSCLISALSLVGPESRCVALLDGHAGLLAFFVYAIKGKVAIRICRPFSQTNMVEEKKSWALCDGVYSYCLLLLPADFMRRGALIMTLRDVSSEALMYPQNVAYMARLTNCKSAALRALKSKTGGGVGQILFKDHSPAERQIF